MSANDSDRRFVISGIQPNFGGDRIEKDVVRYSDGDDDDDDDVYSPWY